MRRTRDEGWRGERRHRLLEAAARVFSRRSYDQASMDEIAQEASVGKPTLYRYFPSKDALFAAVFVEALDQLESRLEAVLEAERDVEARLQALVTELIPTFRDHLVSLRFLGVHEAAIDQSKRRIFRERKARIARFLAEAVEAGVRGGELRGVDPNRTAHLIIGMIWSGTGASRPDDPMLARDITDLVMRGIEREPGADRARGPRARAGEPPGVSARRAAHGNGEAVSP